MDGDQQLTTAASRHYRTVPSTRGTVRRAKLCRTRHVEHRMHPFRTAHRSITVSPEGQQRHWPLGSNRVDTRSYVPRVQSTGNGGPSGILWLLW